MQSVGRSLVSALIASACVLGAVSIARAQDGAIVGAAPAHLSTSRDLTTRRLDVLRALRPVGATSATKLHARRAAKFARARRSSVLPAFTSTNPVLFSAFPEFHGSDSPTLLWNFPTIGYDAGTTPVGYYQSETLETGAPAGYNTADIAVGELGEPAHIGEIWVDGGLYDISDTGMTTPKIGQITITFYANVDTSRSNIPGSSNIALKTDGTPAVYNIPLLNSTIPSITGTYAGLGFHQFELVPPVNLTTANGANPTGKFGVSVAKSTTSEIASPTTVEWMWGFGYPNGGNAVWTQSAVTGVVGTTPTTINCTTDGTYNQSFYSPGNTALTTAPLNYGFELHGTALNGSAPQVATLQGTLRSRGVNTPTYPLPMGSTEPLEFAPGSYTVSLFQPGTSTLVSAQPLFCQPSYDATGALLTNFILEGVPAGTYDIVVTDNPVYYEYTTSNGTGYNFGSIWIDDRDGAPGDSTYPLILYPYADYLAGTTASVTITAGSTNTFNARLERFADISSQAAGEPDGVVDIGDFSTLVESFGLMLGDSGYNPAADLVGPVAPTPPTGQLDDLPDNVVDIDDFSAFLVMFGTGNSETGSVTSPSIP